MPSFSNPFSFLGSLGSLFGSSTPPMPPVLADPASAEPAPATGTANPQGAAEVMHHWVDEKPGVVYLGINDPARAAEATAVPGATVVDGAGANKAMQGKTLAADGKTVLDLTKPEDVATFLAESGAGKQRTGPDGQLEDEQAAAARIAALHELFVGKPDEKGNLVGGLAPNVRDEMAEFVKVLQQVEQGDKGMDRLVISGHNGENKIYSEEGGGVQFDQLKRLLDQFPRAQHGVEDLMLSACHTLERSSNKDGAPYKEMFPELQSVWGYDGRSPSYLTGSLSHIRSWLGASQGDDPAAVQRAAERIHGNAKVKTFP